MTDVIEHNESMPTAPSAVSDNGVPALVQMAIQQNASIETIERLLQMQEAHERRLAEKAFYKGLAGFRSEVPVITKNATGHNSKYASLDNVADTINPLLAKNGLSFYWDHEDVSGGIRVRCILEHSDGHVRESGWLSSPPDKSGGKTDIHAKGSALKYLMRYTLEAALGLSTGGDDDGKTATPTPSGLSDLQLHAITDAMADASVPHSKFCESYGISEVAQLPPGKFDAAIQRLRARADALKAKAEAETPTEGESEA